MMKRSRFDVRVPWPMLVLCAAVGTLPLAVGWVTYQVAERALDLYAGRRP